MENNRTYIEIIRVGCLALMASFSPLAAHAEHVGIAAIVGDDIISTNDVNERRDLVMATAGIPNTPDNQQKITPRILQSLIDETLEMQEAKRQSFTISDAEVDKAVEQMTASRGQSGMTLKEFIERQGLSERSLQNQIRAQLAWNKVVQRKLRHNVSISQDEIARARQAQAAAPGTTELRITALTLPTKVQSNAAAREEEISGQLKKGLDISTIAAQYTGRSDVIYSPPSWISEETMPPMVQQAMRDVKVGGTTPALRSNDSIQFIQLIERRVTKKEADQTEVTLKQIAIPVPAKRTKPILAQLQKTVDTLHTNPGSCMDETLPTTDLPAKVAFAHTKLSALNPDQRTVLSHLDVGGVSAPLPGPDAVRLVMLCERVEPAAGNLPDADEVRQQLFAEKLELEAQKELRNLHRDAFIDIKAAQ